MQTALLEIQNISKNFGSLSVLNDLSLSANRGEIHGLVGGNAEGKSTLCRILAGLEQPEEGRICLDGKPVRIKSRNASEALGISICLHEIELFPDLTIFENIVLGKENLLYGRRIFMPAKHTLLDSTRQIMSELGLDLNPYAKANNLSEGEYQLIQIAKALVGNPRLIILDEATSLLTASETEAVFRVLHRLAGEGKCILFISHQIDFILNHCDRVSILRQGSILDTFPAETARTLPLIELMTGFSFEFRYPKLPLQPGDPVLQVDDISAGILKNISFTLYQGEIVGIAGLVGSGRSTLMKAITGYRKLDSGKIVLLGHKTGRKIHQYFGIVPDDYNVSAMFNKLSIARNITVSNLRRVSRDFIISTERENIYARDMVDRLGIANADINRMPIHLSAGNKQKVVISRSVFLNSDVFLFDEPTQNLSSVCKLEIYNIFNALARKGAAIILISSDFSELLGMCNRIIILKNGRQVGIKNSQDIDFEYLYSETNQ
jgi:ABC-type sugar transport system ATPase subunit